jgi:signal transduction histidine kinase
LKLFQREKKDVVGKTCHKFICPATAGQCPILDKGETLNESERIALRLDGREIPIIKSASFIEMKGERFLLETFIDITDRKRTEQKLLEQSEFLNRIIESLTHPFYAINANDYKVTMANSAAASPEIWRDGITCYSLTHKSDKPCGTSQHICPLSEVKKTKKPITVEHVHFDRFGDERLFEVHGYPLFDKDGNVVQMIEYSLDITERSRAEVELSKTNLELVKSSRLAGMAEVATDILHNVGNVLNSVNVSTALITERLSRSKIPNLIRVTDIIEDHMEDLGTFLSEDPQGKHIPIYLAKVSKILADEQALTAEKLKTLAANIEHIKEIINMQQSYARVCGVEISTTFEEVIEDAIQINQAALERNGIKVIDEYADLGNVSIDKQRVLQILVNLVGNARYALSKSEIEEKLLTIRYYKHGQDQVRIEVADNGIGISEENLTKIFRHGFTTKKHGHGFGLHSGALAAVEMGGSLSAHSDGLGQGVTFTLELPFKLDISRNIGVKPTEVIQ